LMELFSDVDALERRKKRSEALLIL
jgi:hypothetical protein